MDCVYYVNEMSAASDKEKISLLKCCANDALWHFLIISLSNSHDVKNPIVEWTRKHPWEIKINTRTFASEWNRKNLSNEKFATLARNMQYYNNVKIGCYNLMNRHKKLGVYRFFPGYERQSLPAIPDSELFIENKMYTRNKMTSARYTRCPVPTTQFPRNYRNASMNTNIDAYNGCFPDTEQFNGQIPFQMSIASIPSEIHYQNSYLRTHGRVPNTTLLQQDSEFPEKIYNQYPEISEPGCHPNYCMLPVQIPDYSYTIPPMAPNHSEQELENAYQQETISIYCNQASSLVPQSKLLPANSYQEQTYLQTAMQCIDSRAIDDCAKTIVEGDVTEFFSFPERLLDPTPSQESSPNSESSNDSVNLCNYNDFIANGSFAE